MALGEPLPTSSVLGAPATSLEGEDMGMVADVVVEDSTGRIRFAVIERHPDATLLLVPWEVVTVRPGERAVHLNVTTKKLESAPSLHRNESTRITSSDWQRDVCAYYGYRPSWEKPWDDRKVLAEDVRPRHRGSAPLVLGVLVLAPVVGLGYLTVRQGWVTTAGQVSGVAAAVRQTTDVVRNTSADAATTAKVKAALALSKNVSALDIKVDTDDSVTTLIGKVPSPENRELAGQIAVDTSGVRDVRNLLNVDPEIRPDQIRQYLAHRVEELERQSAVAAALHEIPEMEGARVKVRVTGELVALEGTVVSEAQKFRAEQVARSFAGVRRVENRLRNLNPAS